MYTILLIYIYITYRYVFVGRAWLASRIGPAARPRRPVLFVSPAPRASTATGRGGSAGRQASSSLATEVMDRWESDRQVPIQWLIWPIPSVDDSPFKIKGLTNEQCKHLFIVSVCHCYHPKKIFAGEYKDGNCFYSNWSGNMADV